MKDYFKELNIPIDDNKINLFEHYFQELISYNEKVNLTAITDHEEVFIKHFLDSTLASNFIKDNSKIIDIGAGAGFPSLPLKIINPTLNITMVDSLNKRIVFLDELCSKLNLNSNNIHSRAEDLASNKMFRENYDVCVSRAVASLNTLAEYCLPFVKVGGTFIAYKGSNLDELNNAKNAIKILGGEIVDIKKFYLPKNSGERNLIIIKKIKNSPIKFPRGKNLPKIKPII